MRRCCEQTMRIMRENKESLLTIIEVTYQRQAAHPCASAYLCEQLSSLLHLCSLDDLLCLTNRKSEQSRPHALGMAGSHAS